MSQARRYDIDWLRIFATYLLFIFHVSKVYDVAPFYHIKNAELSPGLNHLTSFIYQWHMPLFFLLAGWSAFGSLSTRGSGAFLRERLQRLFLPFVAGCVLLCPLIKYIELRSGLGTTFAGGITHARFDESFLTFLPTFFTRIDRFTWSHLWFLIYLFTFTLLYLPLFSWLVNQTERGLRPASFLRTAPVDCNGMQSQANGSHSTGSHSQAASAGTEMGSVAIYLPILPLALIQVTLRGYWPGFQNLLDDWANFSYYSLYFILGFLMARVPSFEHAVHREFRRAGLIGLVAVLLMIPTDSAESVGLRELISEKEIPKIYEILKNKNVTIDKQTWNKRYREYLEKIKTGSVFEIASVLRDLFILKIDKNLSFGERKMMDTAKSLLVKEISVASKSEETKIEQEFDRKLLKSEAFKLLKD